MAARKVGRLERSYNLLTKLMVRVGLGRRDRYLLTVRGRNSGRSYTTPLTVVSVAGERWLVGPYENVQWVRNVRAPQQVVLSRRGRREHLCAREVDPATAAPVLRAYAAAEPVTRRAFRLELDAPLDAWEAIAPKHPVFRLDPGEPRQGVVSAPGGL